MALLVGSLPVAYVIGGGGTVLRLDDRQIEEVLLTATQTLMGVALILGLRFHRRTAWALLAMFAIQFPITSTTGRLILCGIYAALAVAGLIINRRHLTATVRAPFSPAETSGAASQPPKKASSVSPQRAKERAELVDERGGVARKQAAASRADGKAPDTPSVRGAFASAGA